MCVFSFSIENNGTRYTIVMKNSSALGLNEGVVNGGYWFLVSTKNGEKCNEI